MSNPIGTWEHRTVLLIQRASILDVLTIQMSDFTILYQRKPEMILMHSSLRPAFTKEVIQQCGMPVDSAVAEPCWLDGVPILFSGKPKHIGDAMLRLFVNTDPTKKEIVI